MTLFEPKRTASESTDQPAAVERESNVSGGLRKIAMVVAIGGLAYLAIRRSRSEARSGERIRNRVAAAVEPPGLGSGGSADRGQPESGGVGVPSAASDGDSGSVEASESASETGETVDDPEQIEESEPAGDEQIDDEPVEDEPVEDAETAVEEMEDADEHPTEPGTMDVDRDVVEEAVDEDAVEDVTESEE